MPFPSFPYLSPLNEDTVKKLRSRESNKESLNVLMPFVILSSPAVVTNTPKSKEELRKLYKSENYNSFAYKGCIVANTTDIIKRYQTGETIAGYDLDGKAIKVENEVNRRVSVPMIESVEIDSAGGNNTLKTAQVKIKVFTLKQLEMFELFFLRPGMNVVLEYGWNSSVRTNYNLESKMFATKNHAEYIAKYSEFLSYAEDGYKKAKVNYLKLLQETGGDYDFMAGKVTNFSYSIETDGTYSINLEVSAGNELQTWMPIKQEKESDSTSQTTKKEAAGGFKSWIGKLADDLHKPEFNKTFGKESDWKAEFFNWDAVNLAQKDTSVSKEPYISFKLILDILNKIKLFNISEHTISYTEFFEDINKTKPIIPISSNNNIISPTPHFILPGDLPSILVSKDTNLKNVIMINSSKTEDCSINGKKFNLTKDAKAEKYTIYDSAKEPKTVASTIGNLLNVYFNYNRFIEIYNSSYTQADIVNAILETINENMFGLTKLVLQKESDAPTNSPLIISDMKLKVPHPDQKPEEIFRFKIGALNSIVREFNFNVELSQLMQAQALYASQLAMDAANNDKEDNTSVNKQDAKELADLNFTKNSDNYYSINAAEIKMVKEAAKWNLKPEITGSTNTDVIKDDVKKTDEEIKNLSEVRSKNYVKFKVDLTDTTKPPKNFIYTDPSIIQKQIPKEAKGTTALTYVDISLAIDGIAGIRCGEYFHIDGIPEIYNKNGVFQVQNVKQGISTTGWQTTIEAGFRIKHE
jgi:hypothetical protein